MHKELIVASSYSKNFGLYNERVGACTLVAADSETVDRAFSQMKAAIRANYSNPPAHGACCCHHPEQRCVTCDLGTRAD